MGYQAGILDAVPRAGRHLYFELQDAAQAQQALQALSPFVSSGEAVLGLGKSLLDKLGQEVDGLHEFPAMMAGDVLVPSTPQDLWCWLRGDDLGELVHLARRVTRALDAAFTRLESLESFQYRDSRDLTGYEDGTENPEGDDAVEAALVASDVPGLTGSSFVAVQKWRHDLDRFESFSPQRRDHTIGRRISDNEEIDDAPESAHVKRTAQEDFEPEAFVLRRSMPWGDATGEGLVFVAFGHSFDAFEALLQRMSGAEDGIRDALFDFTVPETGAYFWCPPVRDGELDLRLLAAD